MDDLHIPCVLWFPGDPPPDLSGFAEPIRLPVRVVWRKDAGSEQLVPIESPPQAPPPETRGNDGPANTNPGEPISSQIGNAILRMNAPAAQAQALAPVTDEAQGSGSWYGECASGARIYAHVGNDPLNLTDPSGLPVNQLGDAVLSLLSAVNPIPSASAADVTGFTTHGLNQVINRGVSPSDILDAVNNPLRIVPRANGTIQYRGANATVVLNPLGEVVTAWPQ